LSNKGSNRIGKRFAWPLIILIAFVAAGALLVLLSQPQLTSNTTSSSSSLSTTTTLTSAVSGSGYQVVRVGSPLLTVNDFSQDPSAQWMLLKDAHWDSQNHTLILAYPRFNTTGVAWLRQNTTQPFTAEFSYYVGGGNGGNGFVFMFYKEGNYDPGAGRYLGFTCRPDERPCPVLDAPGYGLEWKTLYNVGGDWVNDPSPSYIGLIKDNVSNHLTYVNITIREQWHRTKIIVKENGLQIYVDQKPVLNWEGSFNRTFSRLGFGASSYVHYDWHLIKDVKIYGNTVTVTGLQPGWTAELRNAAQQTVQAAVVQQDAHEAVLDTTGLEMPLQTSLLITDETGRTVFETSGTQEIWGGDTLHLETLP
jgi:hypothetical protein